MDDEHDDERARPEEADVANRVSGTVHGHVVQARDIGTVLIGSATVDVPLPRQLPPAPSGFVNRENEIRRIDRSATRPAAPGVPPIVVLWGGHGVGKSATGRQWAHLNSERYTDGQLYCDFSDLRHRGGVGVADVLAGFLRALGLRDAIIPHGLAERTALFRSRIAGKRLLLLLDDVDHAAQVKPLIPATADCLVLVTSRAPLEELAHHGADVVPVKPLDDASARALLADVIGPERVRDEPAAVETLARYCAGLPVALRICGARLSGRHEGRPVSWLTAQLDDEARRLERLAVGAGASLQAVFDDAYHALAEDRARVYRRVGLHPGPTFTTAAAAAATGLDAEAAADALDDLCAAHLVEDTGDRFRFHDLLRTHARGAAQRDEPEPERDLTVGRFVRFYRAAAQRMDRAIVPERLRISPAASGEALPEIPELASSAGALTWFERERPNLLGAQRAAAERGWDDEVWQLAEAMWLGYHHRKHFEESHEVYALGVAAASRTGDPEVEARMRQQLSRALIDLKDYDAAAAELASARRLLDGSPHRRLKASVVEFTGVLALSRGDYPAAVRAFERAREVYVSEANPRGVLLQDYLAGRALVALGSVEEAVRRFERAIGVADAAADPLTYGRVLIQLGAAHRTLGSVDEANATLDLAARTMREHDAPYYEAKAVEALADLRREEGDRAGEAVQVRRMVELLTALGDPRVGEASERLERLTA